MQEPLAQMTNDMQAMLQEDKKCWDTILDSISETDADTPPYKDLVGMIKNVLKQDVAKVQWDAVSIQHYLKERRDPFLGGRGGNVHHLSKHFRYLDCKRKRMTTAAQNLSSTQTTIASNKASVASLVCSLRIARTTLTSYSGSTAGLTTVLSTYLAAKTAAVSQLMALSSLQKQAKALVTQI